MNPVQIPQNAFPQIPSAPDPNVIDNTLRLLSKLRHIQLYNVYTPKFMSVSYPEFSHPIDLDRWWISQNFGANPASYYPMLGHDGIDYACNVGTEGRGVVDEMEVTDLILQTNSYGRHIVGKDSSGHKYIFGHLHEFLCEKKMIIKRGQVFFSTGGNLDDPYHGYSTGPHLHWEWRPAWANVGNGYGGAVDQLPYCTYGDAPVVEIKPFASAKVKNPNNSTFGLNVRNKKGTGSIIRTLEADELIQLYAMSGSDVKFQIHPYRDEWVAGISWSKLYISLQELVEESNE
jgi:murein DD-endopeptidase MepM/ murein hydrolase activator NlpD